MERVWQKELIETRRSFKHRLSFSGRERDLFFLLSTGQKKEAKKSPPRSKGNAPCLLPVLDRDGSMEGATGGLKPISLSPAPSPTDERGSGHICVCCLCSSGGTAATGGEGEARGRVEETLAAVTFSLLLSFVW